MNEYQTLYGKDEIPTIRSSGLGSTSKKHCWDLIQVKALTETRTEESKVIRKESMKNGKDFSPRRGKEIKLREDDNANTVTANQGVEQLVFVNSATKDGFEIAGEGDSINLSMPNSKTRRGRVGVGVAQTLDTQANQSVLLQGNIRRLTEIECERLQGLKDNHTKFGMYPKVNCSQEVFNALSNEEKIALFETELVRKEIPKGQRYKLCGNAVTRDIVELIGRKLLTL